MRTALALVRPSSVVAAAFAAKLLTITTTAMVHAQPAPPAVLAPGPAKPDTSGAIDVRGDVPKPGMITVAELMRLEPLTTQWTLHGQSHTVVGIPLEKVLRRVGWDPGVMSKTVPPAEKRVGYKRVVVVTAPDGFQSVFSAAELSEGMGKTQVLVVWMVDGKPLPAEQGRLRLVVPTDAEPSRSLHNLRRIDVVDMRRIVPVAPTK